MLAQGTVKGISKPPPVPSQIALPANGVIVAPDGSTISVPEGSSFVVPNPTAIVQAEKTRAELAAVLGAPPPSADPLGVSFMSGGSSAASPFGSFSFPDLQVTLPAATPQSSQLYRSFMNGERYAPGAPGPGGEVNDHKGVFFSLLPSFRQVKHFYKGYNTL